MVSFFVSQKDQSQIHHLLQILLSAWMTVSIFWIRRQNREVKMKCLSHPVSTQLTWWWNFTFCTLIVHLNHRPIHSSFIEKLIAHECHPGPESPTEYLITCAYLDKQILLRAAQWMEPYLHSFVTCDWACWCLGKDMVIPLEVLSGRIPVGSSLFMVQVFMELVDGHLRALLLCQIWLKSNDAFRFYCWG